MVRCSLFSILLGCQPNSGKIFEAPVEDLEIELVDLDGDGFFSDEDCDDYDALVNPSASEVCDGIDNNCDSEVDEGVLEISYEDADGDGYGNEEVALESCEIPEGYVPFSTDCDDTNPSVYPSAEELCDGLDNNCNGDSDEDVGGVYFVDRDLDGFGDDTNTVLMCELEPGFVAVGGDCDDTNSTISPDSPEVCDNLDNDCDGQTDEGVLLFFYQDLDLDGYGDSSAAVEACNRPSGMVENALDCDDTDDAISPSAPEFCNDGVDNNCDGQLNEEGALGATMWYFDSDLDGFGAGTGVLACSAPADYADNALDCDDTDGTISPDAIEICDSGIDNDCNGLSDDADGGLSDGSPWYLDYDQDGFGGSLYSTTACLAPSGYVSSNSDCDDTNAAVNSTALEVCDGLDNDCDGSTDDDDSMVIYTANDVVYADIDGDGYGDVSSVALACSPSANQVLNAQDCDDSNQYINPLAQDICDNLDNNCNGSIDEGNNFGPYYLDLDGDGLGDHSTMFTGCPTSDSVSNGDDCDDDDATIQMCEDCSMILDHGLSTGDGIYQIDPGNLDDPFEVYCDMSTEGGGWTLAGRQVPAEQFTLTDADINLGGSFDPSYTFRYGNQKIQRFNPTVGWRIVSTDSSGQIEDNAWFRPTCVIDWLAAVGSYQSVSQPLNIQCGIAYTDANFNQTISSYTQSNCSYGIGQNNSGYYCSIRMSSCAWGSVQQGSAVPCNIGDVIYYTVSLWVK